MYRIISLFVVLTVLAGCSTTAIDLTQFPSSSQYCGRYFIYRMCAQDMEGDGKVDVMYFEDSMEVFLHRPELTEDIKNRVALHPCVQIMDEGMMAVSNRLLYITEDTGFFKKAEIKSDLLRNYLRISPDINRCQKDSKEMMAESDLDEFSDEFSEYAFEDLE